MQPNCVVSILPGDPVPCAAIQCAAAATPDVRVHGLVCLSILQTHDTRVAVFLETLRHCLTHLPSFLCFRRILASLVVHQLVLLHVHQTALLNQVAPSRLNFASCLVSHPLSVQHVKKRYWLSFLVSRDDQVLVPPFHSSPVPAVDELPPATDCAPGLSDLHDQLCRALQVTL